jgi:hypothetical protein
LEFAAVASENSIHLARGWRRTEHDRRMVAIAFGQKIETVEKTVSCPFLA